MITIKPFKETPGHCGPACLKMVLSYYGLKKSERALDALCRYNKKTGTSAKNEVRAMAQLGFQAVVRDHCALSDIARLVRRGIPVIVDWFLEDDGHYSVVVGIDKRNIYLLDPAIGKIRTFTHTVFKRVWFDFPGEYIRAKNDMILRRIIIITPRRKQ